MTNRIGLWVVASIFTTAVAVWAGVAQQTKEAGARISALEGRARKISDQNTASRTELQALLVEVNELIAKNEEFHALSDPGLHITTCEPASWETSASETELCRTCTGGNNFCLVEFLSRQEEILFRQADDCGDNFCEEGESSLFCPDDCGYCGDGICAMTTEEIDICSEDCG